MNEYNNDKSCELQDLIYDEEYKMNHDNNRIRDSHRLIKHSNLKYLKCNDDFSLLLLRVIMNCATKTSVIETLSNSQEREIT